MKKDDLVTLEITDLSGEGLGIGHTQDGMAIFVKDTVIGDRVEAKITKAKKNYAFGRLTQVLAPSESRIDAPCPSARPCGGCQIQMMDYPAQLRFKESRVRSCLERIGEFKEIPMQEILGMEEPWRYRNKAQFPVGTNRDGQLITGFYAGRTHSIIACEDCLIGVTENREILDRVLAHMNKYKIASYNEVTGTGLVRHVMIRKGFVTGQIMVCLVMNGSKLPHAQELTDRLWEIPGMTAFLINENTARTNVIMGNKTILVHGQEYIEDKIGDVTYRISARSFYQVNPTQTKKLYDTALAYADLKGDENVWDLYCGIGTISLFLAQKAGSVCGVEIVPEAIEDARKNAELNGFKNAQFFVGKAEEVLPERYEKDGVKADVIVVDPPRSGCDETLLNTMLEMNPERIVYVSCDPATLARDLKILCADGYTLEKVQPVDMFPHSVHVETVVLMSKVNPNK